MIIFALSALLITMTGMVSLVFAVMQARDGYENEFGFYEGEEPPPPDRGGSPPSFPGGSGAPAGRENVLVAS